MAFYEPGQEIVRAEAYDTAIKQIAQYSYKFKQLVSVVSSSAWKDNFFREQTDVPSGPSGNAIKGIPRGADFPNAVLTWEKVASYIQKYGLSSSIDHEDLISNNIDMRNRTILRIAEGVAKAVDNEIATILASDSSIQSFTGIGTTKGGYWDQSSAALIKNLGQMKADIKAYYDQAKGFVCVVHPSVEPEILHYIYEKGAQATGAGQAAFNGSIGNPAGVNIITASVMADVSITGHSSLTSFALFLVPQTCATWKQLMPLQTDTETKRFHGDKITACEYGVTEVHEPKQIILAQVIK